MKKWMLYLIFSSIYLLITFFGLGPILLADGPMTERIMTLLVVIVLYVLITIIFRRLLKKTN